MTGAAGETEVYKTSTRDWSFWCLRTPRTEKRAGGEKGAQFQLGRRQLQSSASRVTAELTITHPPDAPALEPQHKANITVTSSQFGTGEQTATADSFTWHPRPAATQLARADRKGDKGQGDYRESSRVEPN